LVTTDETVSESTQVNLSEGTDLPLKNFSRNIVAGTEEVTLFIENGC